MNLPSTPLPPELDAWMKNHNISNQSLADIFGVSKAYISQMRNGHREMNRFQWDWLKRNTSLIKLAGSFKECSEILKGDDRE